MSIYSDVAALLQVSHPKSVFWKEVVDRTGYPWNKITTSHSFYRDYHRQDPLFVVDAKGMVSLTMHGMFYDTNSANTTRSDVGTTRENSWHRTRTVALHVVGLDTVKVGIQILDFLTGVPHAQISNLCTVTEHAKKDVQQAISLLNTRFSCHPDYAVEMVAGKDKFSRDFSYRITEHGRLVLNRWGEIQSIKEDDKHVTCLSRFCGGLLNMKEEVQ